MAPKYKITRSIQSIIGIDHHLLTFDTGHEFYLDDLFLKAFEAAESNSSLEDVADEYRLDKKEREVLSLGVDQLQGCAKAKGEPFRVPEMFLQELPLKGELPLVSVVIVVYNGRKYLQECIESLKRQTYPNLEIIAVDNGSEDDSVGFIRQHYPEVSLLTLSKNYGYSGGNTAGIKAARGTLLFLLNMDTVLEKHCIANAVSVMQAADEECFAVFPRVLFYDYPRVINAYGCVWHHSNLWTDNRAGLLDAGEFKDVERTFGSIFVALLVKKKLLDGLGGFDNFHHSYGEDFDISYRANSAGYYCLLNPNSVLWHKSRSAAIESLYTFLYFRNFPVMMIKNLELKKLLVRIGYMWRRFILHPLIYPALKKKDYRGLLLAGQILLSITWNMPHILRWRHRIQRLRKVEDVQLWDFNSILPYNLFHYDNRIVLNLANIRASLCRNIETKVHGQSYASVKGESGHSIGKGNHGA